MELIDQTECEEAPCRSPEQHKPTSFHHVWGLSNQQSPSKDGQPWALALWATATCSTWAQPTAVQCAPDSPLHLLGLLKSIISPGSQELFLQVLLLKIMKELFIPSRLYWHWSDIFQCYLKQWLLSCCFWNFLCSFKTKNFGKVTIPLKPQAVQEPTCPPDLPRPYCLPSLNPASQSVLMILSSSLVPLMYLIAFSASPLA